MIKTNSKNKDLVIIPGARHLNLKNVILRKIYNSLRSYFGLKSNPDSGYKILIDRLSKHYDNIYFIKYRRRIINILEPSNTKVIEKTLKTLNKPYDIICFSFGGHLIQKVFSEKKIKNFPEKLILVSSINANKKIEFPKKIKVVNIYSRSDDFVKKMTFLFSGFKGGQHLNNAINIIVDKISHSELELCVKIPGGKFKGLTGFRLLEKFLLMN